jgi:hypothetical protein
MDASRQGYGGALFASLLGGGVHGMVADSPGDHAHRVHRTGLHPEPDPLPDDHHQLILRVVERRKPVHGLAGRVGDVQSAGRGRCRCRKCGLRP